MSRVEGERRTSVEIVPEGRRGFAENAAVITTREEITTTINGDADRVQAVLAANEGVDKGIYLGLGGVALGIFALGIKDLAQGLGHKDAKHAIKGLGKISAAAIVLGGRAGQSVRLDYSTDALETFKEARASKRLIGNRSIAFIE